MAVKYRLVQRKNMAKEVPAGQEKLYYSQTRATGTCDLDELCDQISESSTASSGDVKLVIDRMNTFSLKALAKGEVVQLGELGNLQVLQSSKGAVKTDDFSTALLKKPRLCFRPGARLRDLLKTVKTERFTPETAPSTGGNESESPDEI